MVTPYGVTEGVIGVTEVFMEITTNVTSIIRYKTRDVLELNERINSIRARLNEEGFAIETAHGVGNVIRITGRKIEDTKYE